MILSSTISMIQAVKDSDHDKPLSTASALALCRNAYMRCYKQRTKNGSHPVRAKRDAAIAYRLAMPNMTCLEDIRAYIACVAQGIQLEVFNGRDGSQLLYAGQVALSLYRQKGKESEDDQDDAA